MSAVEQWRSYEFFPGRSRIWGSGDGIPPVESGPGAKHPEADDIIIIMCRNLTTNNFNYFMQIVEQIGYCRPKACLLSY